MANENIVEQVFSPIGQGIRGMARGLFPGAASAADLDRKKIQALLDSEAGRTLMNKARATWYEQNKGVDPYVKGSEDLGKIRAAKDKFAEEELTPETAAYFDAAEKSVLDRMKSTPTRDNRGDETDVFEALGTPKEKKPQQMTRDKWNKSSVEERKNYRNGIGDYFQAPTDTVPQGNMPKTYPQMGIESVDDQATLQDMQKALPEVDMREEYQSDPEGMKKLMQLWKSKKLNKQNLHKAFSNIQQSAQQSLGIR